MAMNSKWLKGLSEEGKQDRKQILKNSQKTLDIVSDLVYNIYVDSLSVPVPDLDSPNWANKQAYNLGRQAVLTELLALLDMEHGNRSVQKTKRKALTDVKGK